MIINELIANTIVLGSNIERKYGKMGTLIGILLILTILMTWFLAMAYITQIGFTLLEKVINHFWFN